MWITLGLMQIDVGMGLLPHPSTLLLLLLLLRRRHPPLVVAPIVAPSPPFALVNRHQSASAPRPPPQDFCCLLASRRRGPRRHDRPWHTATCTRWSLQSLRCKGCSSDRPRLPRRPVPRWGRASPCTCTYIQLKHSAEPCASTRDHKRKPRRHLGLGLVYCRNAAGGRQTRVGRQIGTHSRSMESP